MSTTEARYYLKKLAARYRRIRTFELIVLSLACMMVADAISIVFQVPNNPGLIIAILAGAIVFTLFYRREKILYFGEAEVARYLNQRFPDIEASADLLLRSENLSILQQLQQRKTGKLLDAIKDNVQFPTQIKKSMLAFAGGVSMLLLATFLLNPNHDTVSPLEKQVQKINTTGAVHITQVTVIITPPTYTGLASTLSSDLNLKIPEGSRVRWEISFDGAIRSAYLMIAGRDSAAMNLSSGKRITESTLGASGFYQLQWTGLDGKVERSDFFKITTIADAPPQITIEKPTPYTEVKYSTAMKVPLRAVLHDDYGLQSGWIIATVSKGDGESVRFREEKISFTTPSRMNGRSVIADRTLDLNELDMEPGDELYFYAEAIDSKQPNANRSRTETYFISIPDTTRRETAFDTGAGVDLLPEYFRSQRQIIIDSEKLLEEKRSGKVKAGDFNSRSNDLGSDQKILRLRYGQFMGEEEEGEGTHTGPADGDDKEEDVVTKFGHAHDTENEHNLAPEKKENGKQKENTLAGFVHDHDNPEEATFFEQSIRAKLRAALTMMWDAELHLRLNHPEKSLPYQYRILRLLKEISNDSRVYVRRTGFDPPPVKEDKRLKGDLSEIKNTSRQSTPQPAVGYAAIGKAIPIIELLVQNDTLTLTSSQLRTLRQAGDELAGAALSNPDLYLRSLSALKFLMSGSIDADRKSRINDVRAAFWRLLPSGATSPQQKRATLHTLDAEFLKSREGAAN